MKYKIIGKHHIDSVLVLVQFGVFAVCILAVLLTGAGSYKRLVERDTQTYNRLTCVQYIAAKVRHADVRRAVFVGNFDGVPSDAGDTLFLAEIDDGNTYYTRIYYYDGYVRELFAQADGTYTPEDGEPVLAADDLNFFLDSDSGLLHINAIDINGTLSDLMLALRSEERAV